jgi:hypothetical protein
MCTIEAQAALQVVSAVMQYQNKKNVAKQHAADNKVAMGHYNESYLYDLSKIDNESGNAVREKALEEFKIKQKKALDIATALNLGFGNPLRAVQSVGGVADNDLNYVGFQFTKDMTTLQHQEHEAYAHMVKGYSSLTSPTQPSLLGTSMQIASAGINYAVQDNKNRHGGVYTKRSDKNYKKYKI